MYAETYNTVNTYSYKYVYVYAYACVHTHTYTHTHTHTHTHIYIYVTEFSEIRSHIIYIYTHSYCNRSNFHGTNISRIPKMDSICDFIFTNPPLYNIHEFVLH